nr:hypothetical protein [Tanacetum cinerariifolium]
MSEASFAVTYTFVYINSESGRIFWGADEELSDGGSPRVIVYGYDGLLMMLVAPPSPDYIPGPEEPQTPPAPQDEDEHELMFIQPHDPDFVPEPIYPEYIPLKDEHILSAEEQPLPPVASPTVESPGYVAESDPEEDPEEYEEDEVEDGLVDYPMDGGDDGDDDDDGNSSGYDVDDEDEDNKDEEKEEEHLALADFAVVIPIDELVSPLERTEPTITPPSTNTTTIGATITIRPQTSISLPPEQDDIPESEQPPRKRLCLATLGSMYEVGEISTRGRGVDYGFTDTVEAEMRHRGIREVGYGIRDPWIDPAEAVPDMAFTTLEKDGRTCISQRVAIDSQQVNLLIGDRMTLQDTIWIMEEEAYAACEAWAQLVKENQEKDKIKLKPNKNKKRGEARKCQKQLQSIKQEKMKKIQARGAKSAKS